MLLKVLIKARLILAMTHCLNLSLIVIRVANVERSAAFYSELGLTFVAEQHGQGPVHYSTQIGPTLLELYPASKKYPVTSTRLGFTVHSIENIFKRWQQSGYNICSQTKDSQKNHTVVQDPDGHRIELIQKPCT